MFAVTGFAVPSTDSGAVIRNLKVENLVNPIGTDAAVPRFSWQMADSARGQRQTAYQILVAESAEQLASGDYAWDSGRVESDESQNIPYAGDSLKAATRYYWQVRVWDKDGAAVLSAEEAYFETGLMEENPLGDVQWLTKGKKPVELVNTVFTLEADVRIHVDAAGLLFGRQDDANYFFWQLRIIDGRTYLRPHKCDNGNWVFPGNVDITDQFPPEAVIGKTLHVKIEVDNGRILTYINDIQVAEGCGF